MAEPHIELKDLTIRFKRRTSAQRSLKKSAINAVSVARSRRAAAEAEGYSLALDSVSLEFKKGDRVGIVGPNGAGKSTLLRAIAGIYPPVSGSLSVVGRRAVVFNPMLAMHAEATGREALRLIALVSGLDDHDITAKMDEMIEFTELASVIDQPIHTYSAGMKMRIAFAACTTYIPDIIIIDEGIGVADDRFQEKAARQLMTWLDGASIVVLASHDMSLVRAFCSELVEIEEGRVVSRRPIEDP